MARTPFILLLTGAFLIWCGKGFKGKFDNEMVSIDDQSSEKGNMRYFLGLGFWILVIIVSSALLSRPTETAGKMYKLKTNDKGEIIELEEVE